jgi:phospholipid transport system substrate-binding protein
VVIDASTRIHHRAAAPSEFQQPASLRSYIDSELNRTFDRDYAARLVLGPHARGARWPSSCSPMPWPTA